MELPQALVTTAALPQALLTARTGGPRASRDYSELKPSPVMSRNEGWQVCRAEQRDARQPSRALSVAHQANRSDTVWPDRGQGLRHQGQAPVPCPHAGPRGPSHPQPTHGALACAPRAVPTEPTGTPGNEPGPDAPASRPSGPNGRSGALGEGRQPRGWPDALPVPCLSKEEANFQSGSSRPSRAHGD